VIQSLWKEIGMRRHELSDEEWAVIEPLLPNNSRGIKRVDDRRVINGILRRFRTGSSKRDVPERYGLRTTLYNRFSPWRKAGVWDRLLDAVSKRYDGDIVMIDSSCVRVHRKRCLHPTLTKRDRYSEDYRCDIDGKNAPTPDIAFNWEVSRF
jgi:transposase